MWSAARQHPVGGREKNLDFFDFFDRFLVQKSILFYRKRTSKPQKFLGRLRRPKSIPTLSDFISGFDWLPQIRRPFFSSRRSRPLWAPTLNDRAMCTTTRRLPLCLIDLWCKNESFSIANWPQNLKIFSAAFGGRKNEICFQNCCLFFILLIQIMELWTNLKCSTTERRRRCF